MVGVIAIIISLGLLMYLAYRGISVLVLAPILALGAAFISGGADAHVMAMYTETFMISLANYVKSYFPIFLLGAIFGKLMDDSGSAKTISHAIATKLGKDKAILAVVLSCAILTFGGVSLFVVAFAVFPIATGLFREAGIPKRLIPGSIALGSFTFTMTALPGTPAIQNAIPMPFYGTDAYAAPILGIVATIIMFGGGITWLTFRAKKAQAAGEGYGNHANEKVVTEDKTQNLPSFGVAILPILLVIVINFILSKFYYVADKYDAAYLETFKTTLAKVAGTWSLVIALAISIVVAILINLKRLKSAKESVNQGALGSLLAVINVGSEVGYGNVIQSLAAFAIVKEAILGVSDNPIISELISVNVLAGITGSSSGGMSIALGVLGKTYLDAAVAQGINPEVLHRIASVASGGLDSLPHNGAVITLLSICGLTHKESYADVGFCSVVVPVSAGIIITLLALAGIV